MFGEFPATSYDEWRKAAEATLKGAPFEKKLVTKTYEDIDLQPMYRQEDIEGLSHLDSLPGFGPYVRSTSTLSYVGKPWDVSQEIACSTPEEFNNALLSDMERGQNSVNLIVDRATLVGIDADGAPAGDVGRGGVSISSVEDLATALKGIDLEKTPIYIQASTSSLAFTALLIALVRRKGQAADKLQGCVGMDPLGILAVEGALARPVEEIYDVMAKLTAWASGHAPQLQTITVQGYPYNDGGASATQELAFTLATGVEYLREMLKRGVAVDAASERMRFAFSLGSNMFMEIARLRAARLLWARIVKAFGGAEEAQKMRIHGRTSRWNKTRYDPYANMLRTTTEAFSGIVGGVDSLHVGPFDEVLRTPDEFSRRIARNTHTILREECHLPRTIDPAGGSWYVEALTDAVAKKSWQLFQEVEKQGGIFQALQAGFPQAEVEKIAQKRATNAALRKDIFVGTNMYPNPRKNPCR
jgi:methylmalonyl-CoA mutase